MSRLLGCLLVILSLESFAGADPAACDRFEKSVSAGSSSKRLHAFLDAQWTYRMTEFPEWATFVGYPGRDDRWTDMSVAALDRRNEETKCQLQALQRIPDKSLSQEDRITWDLARRDLEMAIEGQKFPGRYLILDQMGGPQMDVADLLQAMSKSKVSDVENMIARIEKFPALEEQDEALLREGLQRKVTAVRLFLQKVPAQFDKILTPKIEDSPLYLPFKDLPQLAPEDRDRLQKKALQALETRGYPALRRLREFLVREYIPGARESISWSEMPQGREWYAYLVKGHTTTSQSPEELHELGLSEVKRLTGEMQQVLQQVKFKGDIKAFNQFLLKDPQFFYTDPAQLMQAYRDLAKRIDPELPKLFRTLPRLTYGVREMPAYKAPEAPTAYYMPGSPESGRAGYFEANTYDLKSRPKWGMEALTMHEAVPGHHLQIALAQEIEGLPEFRKNGGYTAFVEGWGLYAEGLGADLGFYKDPYSKYGQLSYELWRAIRLVVDTGMHAKGWTRDQALTYYMDLMPKSRLESEVEIDRYISWPGQALAYKVGQLKFRELRARAQTALGDRYDIRSFHDEVLRHGPLPLDVLEKLFNQWLAKEKAKPAKKTAGR